MGYVRLDDAVVDSMEERENCVFYRDDCNYKYIVFEGSQKECEAFCDENNWELDGEELELWV